MIFFPVLVAMAAQQAPDFSLTITSSESLEVAASPPPGHHFNIQAPMMLEENSKRIKPYSSRESKIRFRLPPAKKNNRNFAVSLFLCDDAKTFCEQHKVSAAFSGRLEVKKTVGEKNKPAPHASIGSSAHLPSSPENGFIVNAPQAALAKAKREKKLLLIDFYGIWCPPCNMLSEEVFSTPEFKQSTEDFVRLKLDADSDASWDLKAKYKIKGYPTVVFATPDGDEIDRVVGFQPKNEFLKRIKLARQSQENSFQVLKAKAEANDSAAARKLGLIYLARQEYDQAVRHLGREKSKESAEARIGLARQELNDQKSLEALETALSEFPQVPESIDWRMQLASLYEKDKQAERARKQLKEATELAERLASSPEKLAGTDLMPADLWSMSADGHERLKEDSLARSAWAKAAAEYRKNLDDLGDRAASERGYNLEYAYCLWKSGNVTAAEALYESLEVKYPKEFTFHYGHARMLYELGKFESASVRAEKAYRYSYGDNRLRAAHLLARAYAESGKMKKGLETISAALQNTMTLPADKNLRTHRYVQQLRELEAKLKQPRS